jgi:hypothetical protein
MPDGAEAASTVGRMAAATSLSGYTTCARAAKGIVAKGQCRAVGKTSGEEKKVV